jgi:hypothetical protein
VDVIFAIGLTIGLIVGGGAVMLLFAPLVDQLNHLEELGYKHKKELVDLECELQERENRISNLEKDFATLYRMAPKETVMRFFDSPYSR